MITKPWKQDSASMQGLYAHTHEVVELRQASGITVLWHKPYIITQ